jgi:hypothetical protein
MTKFHDELLKQQDPEHDELVANILESIDAIAELIYPKTGEIVISGFIYPTNHKHKDRTIYGIKIEKLITGSNGFLVGYADVIAKIYEDWGEKYRGGEARMHYFPYLIIDAKPKLTDFGAVTRQIKTYQSLLYVREIEKERTDRCLSTQYMRPTDPSTIDRDTLDKKSKMVIVTNSEPTRAALIIAKNEGISLIIHNKETGRFSLADPPKNNNTQATLEATT